MANVERIRQAFAQWPYYQEYRGEVDSEVEDWVSAIIEGWKRGYAVAVIDGASAEMIEAGQEIDISSVGVEDPETHGRPSAETPESQWRETALEFLEDVVEKLAAGGDLLWIEVDEATGISQAFFAFDELEED